LGKSHQFNNSEELFEVGKSCSFLLRLVMQQKLGFVSGVANFSNIYFSSFILRRISAFVNRLWLPRKGWQM
jgi:hypothetical protein